MTYDRAIDGAADGLQEFRGRKSWPRILSPMGRGAHPERVDDEHKRRLLPLGRRWPEGPDEGAFMRSLRPQVCRRGDQMCATRDADCRHSSRRAATIAVLTRLKARPVAKAGA